MKNKLIAIWHILTSHKLAVFTLKYAKEDPIYMTADWFRWVLSTDDKDFINLIQNRIDVIKNT